MTTYEPRRREGGRGGWVQQPNRTVRCPKAHPCCVDTHTVMLQVQLDNTQGKANNEWARMVCTTLVSRRSKKGTHRVIGMQAVGGARKLSV